MFKCLIKETSVKKHTAIHFLYKKITKEKIWLNFVV